MMIPVELAKWWNTSNMVQLHNNKFKSMLGTEMFGVSQFSYMVRTQHNFTLPKGFKMEMVGMYLSPFVEGQFKLNGFGWVDAGMTKSFKGDKFSLTVNGTDLFRTQKIKGNINFDKINTDTRQYNNQQGARETLRWKFSQGETSGFPNGAAVLKKEIDFNRSWFYNNEKRQRPVGAVFLFFTCRHSMLTH